MATIIEHETWDPLFDTRPIPCCAHDKRYHCNCGECHYRGCSCGHITFTPNAPTK